MGAKCLLFILAVVAAHLPAAKDDIPHLNLTRTRLKSGEALAYCNKHHYNNRYCIFIDMNLPSGIKRLVVWDLTKKDTLLTGLVSHGCGKGPWSWTWSKDKPTFSNAFNSHCTSLGKYKINGRAYSQWGVHVKYYLNGLDSTNSNATKRQMVFHSWDLVPDKEIYPNGTPEGWGCPAISNNTMKTVDALLRKQKGPVLLWIYN